MGMKRKGRKEKRKGKIRQGFHESNDNNDALATSLLKITLIECNYVSYPFLRAMLKGLFHSSQM